MCEQCTAKPNIKDEDEFFSAINELIKIGINEGYICCEECLMQEVKCAFDRAVEEYDKNAHREELRWDLASALTEYTKEVLGEDAFEDKITEEAAYEAIVSLEDNLDLLKILITP